MDDYQEGEKFVSLCAHCEKRVSATLKSETLSLCDGAEEVKNVLVDICSECGNMTAIPAKSLPSIQQAMKKLVESGVVTERSEITVELKSNVDRQKRLDNMSRADQLEEYPLVAAE